MSDFVAGIVTVIIVAIIFLFGYGFKKETVEQDIRRGRPIYIKDYEYKCEEVK